MRVQVAIIGAGPAGLLLGALLHRAGIETIVLEQRSAAHVLGRIRAGVLEPGTVGLLEQAGVADGLHQHALEHRGLGLVFGDRAHRIDLHRLTSGKSVWVYGQTEITRDLMEARRAAGLRTEYEAASVRVHDLTTSHPRVTFDEDGATRTIACDFIAGCDGFHGTCRPSIPDDALHAIEQVFPFGWLGVLADTPPVSPELRYVNHARGFALCSMRSATRSRHYVQCAPDDDVRRWSDDAFWDELRRRLDPPAAEALITGPSIEKSITPVRSFLVSAMRYGRLFLAGDAAHILPPTGAKGLNLAAADVGMLSAALVEHYAARSNAGLDAYDARCRARAMRATRFSIDLTTMLHAPPDGDARAVEQQRARLDALVGSEAATTAFARGYVGDETA